MPFQYADYEYAVAATQLVFMMMGMGATLTLAEFRDIARRPHGVAFVFVMQYVGCSLLAMGFAKWFGMSPGIALGLLIVAAMPSGALSNVFTYLGKGNVPLSITATCASTFGCLFLTPLVLGVIKPEGLPSDFAMPTGRIIRDIVLCLLVPLGIGMSVAHRWPDGRRVFSRWCIRIGLVFLAMLIVGSLTSGRIDVFAYGLKVPFALVLFCGLLLGPLQIVAYFLLGFSADNAFTLAIEIAMRNCNVAILVKASAFPVVVGGSNAIGDGVLFVALFYGGASLVLGATPILRRRLIDRLQTKYEDADSEGPIPP